MTTFTLTIPDMACAACVETITQTVQTLDAQATVSADIQTKNVTITTQTEPEIITAAITTAGYSPSNPV